MPSPPNLAENRPVSVASWTVAEAPWARAAYQAGVSGEGPGTAAGPGVLVAARFRTR
jgi:hypothetical protein